MDNIDNQLAAKEAQSDREKLKAFFRHDNLVKLKAKPGTSTAWDFSTAYGDTIREKYESFYVKITELTNVCIRKGANGLFWIVTSPEVGSMFADGFGAGFNDCGLSQIPMGGKEVYYLGTINRKWRVYIDPLWEADELMVGANWESDIDPKHVGVMKAVNFIV
jgi:hypothetical protein